MKKAILLTAIWLCIPAVVQAAPTAADTPPPKKEITIVADPWCPYTCDEGSEHPGFMIEIAQQAFKHHGIDVKYKVVPWSRAIEVARTGGYEAIVGASRGDAPDFVFPELTQGLSSQEYWIPLASKWAFAGEPSLDAVKIGAIASYSYGTLLDEYFKKNAENKDHVQMVGGDNALEISLRKLEAGRIDVFPEDRNVIHYYYKEKNIPLNVKSAGPTVADDHPEDNFLYIAFGPGNAQSKQYAEWLSSEVKTMRDSGELKKILDYYGVEDWFPVTKK